MAREPDWPGVRRRRIGAPRMALTTVAIFAVAGGLAGAAVRPVVSAVSVPSGQRRRGRRATDLLGLRWCRSPACRTARLPLGVLEVLLGLIFALLATHYTGVLPAMAFCWLTAFGTALGLIDLRTQRLPNVLTAPAYLGVLALLCIQAALYGDTAALVRGLVCGLALAAFYTLLSITTGGLGLGDAKLAASLGTALGWISVTAMIAGTLLGLILAAASGLVAIRLGRLRWRQGFPFGPFLILSTVITLLAT